MKKNLVLTILALCALLPVKAEQKDVDCGSKVKIEATAKTGYKFLYWEDDHTNTNPVRIVENVQVAVTLKAVFGQEYDLKLSAQEGGAVYYKGTTDVCTGKLLISGESIEVTATVTDDCYEFIGWSDGVMDATRTFTANESLTQLNVEAKFQRKKFEVKATSNNDDWGSVSISLVTE